MTKQPKSDSDKLPKREQQARFEAAVDHMLQSKPRVHAQLKKKRESGDGFDAFEAFVASTSPDWMKPFLKPRSKSGQRD